MRFLSPLHVGLLAITAVTLFSCNEKEDFTTDQLTDYQPLTVGKYITYRVDSTVYTNFGRTTEVHKYQIKNVVDAVLTDAGGRPLYRINRFIRDTAGLTPWLAMNEGVYFVTLLPDQLESTEDNLRVIKFHLPIRDGYSWKGNKYLSDDPYKLLYTFSNDDNMVDWDFYYDGNPASFSYRTFNYSNVLSVEQADERFNVPITIATSIAYKSRSVEKYSKGIGLVYREYEMWEYQPNPTDPAGPNKRGFGLVSWMIDHN